MAIRVRKDGTMWCAAHTAEQSGDTYIDDGLHYQMSVVHGAIVALPMPAHLDNPQWWWADNAPEGCDISFVELRAARQSSGEAVALIGDSGPYDNGPSYDADDAVAEPVAWEWIAAGVKGLTYSYAEAVKLSHGLPGASIKALTHPSPSEAKVTDEMVERAAESLRDGIYICPDDMTALREMARAAILAALTEGE